MINVAQLQSSHNRATSHPGQCCTIFDGQHWATREGTLGTLYRFGKHDTTLNSHNSEFQPPWSMLSMFCDIQWSTLWTLNNIEWWSTLYKYVQWSRLYNFEFPQHPLVNPGTNTLVNAVQYSMGNTMVNDAGALPRNNRKERGETHCPHSRSRIHSKTMENTTMHCARGSQASHGSPARIPGMGQ